MTYLQTYFKCSSCGQIELENHSVIVDSQYVCQHCKENKKEVWPHSDVAELLGFVLNYEYAQPRYSQVVSVFLSTAFELLLEELVTMMMYWDLTYDQGSMLVDALLDSHQGRSRMLWLYKRVGHGSFSEEAREIGYSDFATNWDKLASTRNKIVHGKLNEAEVITQEYAGKLIEDGLEVFRILYNQYFQETSDYKYAMRTPEEKAKDDELSKKIDELF
jgi:hypothetical protein